MNKDAVAEMSQQYQVDAAEKLVPEGYKQTEVGVIPEDWEVLSLGELGTFKNGINKGANDFGYGLPFVNLMDVFGKPAISNTDHLGLINSTELDRKEYSLEFGDVLFIRSSVKPSGVGLTSVVLKDLVNTVYSGFLIRFRSSGSLSVKFKKFCFYEEDFRKRIISSSTVSANTNINQDALKAIFLAFPRSIKEQDAIANALSDVDALLSELEKLIAKKQAIKTATMQQLLTGRTRLPQFAHHPDGSKKGYKQSELGEIPEDWEVVEFSAVVEKIVGGGTPSRSNPAYWGNDIPWVTVKDFATFSPFTAQEKITKLGLQNSSSNLISSGTLITSTRMALGKAVIYKVDVAINQDLKAIFTSRNLETSFLCFWFENNAQKIEELGSGSTVKGLSLTDLRKIPFLLQSMEEQTAIATILADMDEEIQALEQRLNKTRQIKQGMMQELLTGKTRLVASLSR